MRTWVIPDVHGCLATLRSLVEESIRPVLGDTIIFLGDLVDRGPDSKGVLDYVMNLPTAKIDVKVLRGNHEDFMAQVYEDEKEKPAYSSMLRLKSRITREWLFHGGRETLDSFNTRNPLDIPEKYLHWIAGLEYVIEHGKYLIVHAGFNFANDDIFSDKRAMLWSRDFQIDTQKLGDRTIIHGHVPVSLEFIYHSVSAANFRFIDLDNGVYMAGRPGYGNLLALELNSMQLLVQHNIDME